MKMELGCALLTAIVLAGCSATTPQGNLGNDKLAGVWYCLSAIVNGNPLTPEVVGQLRLHLTASRYQTLKGDQAQFDSTYTLDTTKTPKQINILGTEGELAGKDAQGIYALEGDTLTLCYTMPGKERPKAFESVEGSAAYLLVWKRGQ